MVVAFVVIVKWAVELLIFRGLPEKLVLADR